MAWDDDYWARRDKQGGHFEHQAPQFIRDVAPGKPLGVPPPDYARRVTEPGEVHQCVVPKHWYLGSLPPKRLEPALIRLEIDFVSSGTNVLGTYEIPDDTTFVADLYHFYATTPIVGDRTEMLQPHELGGFVDLKLRGPSKAMPYQFGGTINGVEFGGQSFLTNDPLNDKAIPIFLNGKIVIEPVYTMRADVPFTVSRVGFVLRGWTLNTGDLEHTLRECSIIDR